VLLWHITTVEHAANIETNGLRACYNHDGIWLCTDKKKEWAIRRVRKRHAVALEDIVLFPVSCSRRSLTQRDIGIFVSLQDIPSTKIGKAEAVWLPDFAVPWGLGKYV
jgi:hypothetical protein